MNWGRRVLAAAWPNLPALALIVSSLLGLAWLLSTGPDVPAHRPTAVVQEAGR